MGESRSIAVQLSVEIETDGLSPLVPSRFLRCRLVLSEREQRLLHSRRYPQIDHVRWFGDLVDCRLDSVVDQSISRREWLRSTRLDELILVFSSYALLTRSFTRVEKSTPQYVS